MLDLLRDLDAYTRWADARIFDVLPADGWMKEVGGSFGTLRNTATHLVSAQWIWISRWRGTSPSAHLSPEDFPTPDALRARADALSRERAGLLAEQSEDSLARPLSYLNLQGKPDAQPLGEILAHMYNHSTYHRGQLAAFLRDLGVKPPSTDYILWIRSGKP
jgi:uncharacterized damage-inducible protein DinB